MKRLHVERSIPFQNIHAVRMTLVPHAAKSESRVELLCAHEELECPPCAAPSQLALCLAMLIRVRLIRVSCGGEDELVDPPD